MKRTILALMIASAICSSEPSATGEPLSISLAAGDVENSVNGGIVQPGARVRVEIQVKNSTNIDLRLVRMWFSCNCSRISTNIDVLKAGESGRASINYDLSWLLGNAETTAFMAFARKDGDGAVYSTVKTKLITTIAPALVAAPAVIDFGHAKQAESLQAEIKITRGQLPLAFDDIHALISTGDMIASVRRDDNAAWTIQLRPKAGIPVGSLVNELEIYPTAGLAQEGLKDYSIQVPIRGTLDGEHTVSPSVCFWGSVAVGETYIRRIKISRGSSSGANVDPASLFILQSEKNSEFSISEATATVHGVEFDLAYKPRKGVSPKSGVEISGSVINDASKKLRFKISSLSVK